MRRLLLFISLLTAFTMHANAQQAQSGSTAVDIRDMVHYTGTEIAYPGRHDGGLSPVVGVHNIQLMRGAKPWTYNHQPMMAYWHGKFYVHYLTDPRHEHEAPGKTMLMTSTDGYTWTAPVELFPEYKVPDGTTKEELPGVVAKDIKAVMHQRVGFHVSKNDRLIATGYYGIALNLKDHPNDGNGIGRVVREIKADGSFGPIYFIRYNHGFNEKNTDYPFYKKSKDKGFVKAVDEILADATQRMQWVEEADKNDPLIPLNKDYKAFCYYTLPDGRIVGLWKHALQSISTDRGLTWREPATRAPGFVNSNAKIWGQRLSDGTYATVYNPAEYRWPLAISLSKDGLEYTTLNLVHGDITPERHGGGYKNYGPQYTRGIQEGNGTPPDGNLWVTYSNNKEDMWVSRIVVPVLTKATSHAAGFGSYKQLADMNDWNLYVPRLCPVTLEKGGLMLRDSDPYDYAKVERVIPASKEVEVEMDLCALQNNHGALYIEFLDAKGNMASRIQIDETGDMRIKGGARFGMMQRQYEAGKTYHVKAMLSCGMHRAVYFVNGKRACVRQFDTPVEAITRIVFRTGALFTEPNIETPADQDFDMPRADETDPEASYFISNVASRPMDPKAFPLTNADEPNILQQADAPSAVLSAADYRHYVEYFNGMEDENIVSYIPNAKSWEWMQQNVPLFDCPDKDMEEMYYYRWWSLRKHIVNTPVGFGMTEFLVNRSYADKYNLIACAIGHHVMESRWMRDPIYLNQILRTWYFGNEGKPMSKMNKFSSWNPAAIYEAWKVMGTALNLKDFKASLEAEYADWKSTHQLPNGLYWQADVRDGMEESISGARRQQYARPTINSYMYGNARALAAINRMYGDSDKAKMYDQEAQTLKEKIEKNLWNEQHQFFETLQKDTSANVREAIGFIPWYFNMPQEKRFETAWLQLVDEKGFSAPYGLTTAERRHPQFRSHGVGTCEWDGAVWPFATSQTLTAFANYLNSAAQPVIGDTVYFREMKKYVESQHHRGRPYIGEYLDEKNGAWLMGDRERSRYYNHSTFADLVITGLVGVRPQAEKKVVIHPLVPAGQWKYFCLDAVPYQGHLLTILWDEDGQRYHQGTGLTLLVDGKRVANRSTLGELTYQLP